jgi:hypothetical protein
MLYLIIEKFKTDKVKEIYQRVEEKGRLLPEGLIYINSWITKDLFVCYQIMETDDYEKLQQWMNSWMDLINFEIIPVVNSNEAKERILNL